MSSSCVHSLANVRAVCHSLASVRAVGLFYRGIRSRQIPIHTTHRRILDLFTTPNFVGVSVRGFFRYSHSQQYFHLAEARCLDWVSISYIITATISQTTECYTFIIFVSILISYTVLILLV